MQDNQEENKQLQLQIQQLQKENQELKKKLEDQKKLKDFQKNPKLDQLFEKNEVRKYALKLCYFGHNYQGIQIGDNSEVNTIEEHLFRAFYKTCLIQDIKTANYSRSGRTDKGVSALGNVIALDLRTPIVKQSYLEQQKQQKQELQIEQQIEIQQQMQQEEQNNNQSIQVQKGKQNNNNNKDNKDNKDNTFNYVTMLNSVLPEDIRILAQVEVRPDFNARFDCKARVYKYFFMEDNLDLNKLYDGSQLLVGEHDFRNFCKVDVTTTTKYVRQINSVKVEKVNDNPKDQRLNLYCITIEGSGFLYHQIRCIMSILFLIGKQKEDKSVIQELFDINKYKARPSYMIADEHPLILYDCIYEDSDVKFNYDHQDSQQKLYSHFTDIYKAKLIESYLARTCFEYLFLKNDKIVDQNIQFIQQKSKRYKPIKDLQLSISPEQQISNLKGKKLEKFNQKTQQKNNYQEGAKNFNNNNVSNISFKQDDEFSDE